MTNENFLKGSGNSNCHSRETYKRCQAANVIAKLLSIIIKLTDHKDMINRLSIVFSKNSRIYCS